MTDIVLWVLVGILAGATGLLIYSNVKRAKEIAALESLADEEIKKAVEAKKALAAEKAKAALQEEMRKVHEQEGLKYESKQEQEYEVVDVKTDDAGKETEIVVKPKAPDSKIGGIQDMTAEELGITVNAKKEPGSAPAPRWPSGNKQADDGISFGGS